MYSELSSKVTFVLQPLVNLLFKLITDARNSFSKVLLLSSLPCKLNSKASIIEDFPVPLSPNMIVDIDLFFLKNQL
jgi:hypothetical protein